MFAGTRPTCVRVDDISFRRPVDVGDLLRFHSYVIDVHQEDVSSEDEEVKVGLGGRGAKGRAERAGGRGGGGVK